MLQFRLQARANPFLVVFLLDDDDDGMACPQRSLEDYHSCRLVLELPVVTSNLTTFRGQTSSPDVEAPNRSSRSHKSK